MQGEFTLESDFSNAFLCGTNVSRLFFCRNWLKLRSPKTSNRLKSSPDLLPTTFPDQYQILRANYTKTNDRWRESESN